MICRANQNCVYFLIFEFIPVYFILLQVFPCILEILGCKLKIARCVGKKTYSFSKTFHAYGDQQ